MIIPALFQAAGQHNTEAFQPASRSIHGKQEQTKTVKIEIKKFLKIFFDQLQHTAGGRPSVRKGENSGKDSGGNQPGEY